jgi:hypothetical protein
MADRVGDVLWSMFAEPGEAPGLIDDMELMTIDGGAHAISCTHSRQANNAQGQFVGAEALVT